MSTRKYLGIILSCLILISLFTPISAIIAAPVKDPHILTQPVANGPEPVQRASSRAQYIIWSESDWSGGAYNLSNGIETDLSPGVMVLSSDISDMVELFSPTNQEGIYSMVDFNDELTLSASSPGTGTNKTIIYSCDDSDLQCTQMTELEEDLVYELLVSDNGTRLYIPGAAPTNQSGNGTLYITNGTEVQKKVVRTGLSRSVSVMSVAEVGTKIYVASTDENGRAYIYRSVDDGQTWIERLNLLPKPYTRSFKAMINTGGTLLVQSDGLASEGAKIEKFNGTFWRSDTVPGLTTDYGAFVSSNAGDADYFINGGNMFIDKGDRWDQVPAPFSPTVSEIEVLNATTGNLSPINDLMVGRLGHTSDDIDGKIVTIGGIIGDHPLRTTETLDLTSGNVTLANNMVTPRAYHASARLNDGSILVIGGLSGLPPDTYSATTSVERFNITNGWAITSSLSGARYNHSATVLNDGKVLVCGGMDGTNYLSSTEIYDPSNGNWAPAAAMNEARANHVALLLNNGSVLVAGGRKASGALDSSEIYMPTADKWYQLPVLPYAAFDAGASLLDNGNVLVSGGTDDGTAGTKTSVVLDTTTDTWGSPISMANGRFGHTSTNIGGGSIMVAGGVANTSSSISPAEIYTSGSWAMAPKDLGEGRVGHTAVFHNSTNVVFIGGVRPSYFGSSMFKAAAPAGQDGIVVGAPDGTVHIYDGNGNWASGGPVPGGLEVLDVFTHNGRVHASTNGPGKVFVASAQAQGELISNPYDLQGYIENGTLNWDALTPVGTSVKVQVRSARSMNDLKNGDFLGPDGTNSTYFTASGTDIGDSHIGNDLIQYRILLETDDGALTPLIRDIFFKMNITQLSITQIVITPDDVIITADESIDLNATGYDQFGLEMHIDPLWSTDGGLIAPSTGLYSPRETGVWTVYAKAGGIQGTANVTVLPGQLMSIEVTPPTWFGSIDEFQDFDAAGLDQWGNDISIPLVWSVSGGGGDITTDGNFTPIKPGKWTIYANHTSTGISGNASVTVWAGEPERIVITPNVVTLIAGEHQLFHAQVLDHLGNSLEDTVEWEVDGGGNIDPFGNLTARAIGDWTVYANLSLHSLSASASVTIIAGDLFDITMIPDDIQMVAGESRSFKVYPVDSEGNLLSIPVKWTVTGGGDFSNGIYNPTIVGSWTIYANASGISAMANVKVVHGPFTQLSLNPENVELEVMDSAKFDALAMDEYGNAISEANYIWSTDSELGTVTSEGLFIAGEKAARGVLSVTVTVGNTTLSKNSSIHVKALKAPPEEVEPTYYFILEFIILLVMISASILIFVELKDR